MLIKSLKMKNFRQFKGETFVEFSCDPEHNVTIILGNNTFGKTTLLQAFNWCFYETVTFDNRPDFLLNLEVANEMFDGDTESVLVEITLMHDNREYIITRIQNYECNNNKVDAKKCNVKASYKDTDGQIESIKTTEVESVITHILPKDLSDYFFFDTERVRSISKKKDVSDAVKGLMGLTTIENAIKHIGSAGNKRTVLGKLYNGLDEAGNAQANQALEAIRINEGKREYISEQLDSCKNQIKQYEARKGQVEEILRDNKATANLQIKKDELKNRVEKNKGILADYTNHYFEVFNAMSLQYFAQPLIQRTSDFLAEANIDDKGIRDLTATTIKEIIKRGKCICGADIEEGNEAYNKLIEELLYVPPESIGNTIRNYKEKLSIFCKDVDVLHSSLNTTYRSIYDVKTQIQEDEDQIEEISSKIKGKESMKQYENELDNIKSRLKYFDQKKESLIREDTTSADSIDKLKKLYNSKVAVSEKNKETMEYITYAEAILEWLTDKYESKEIIIREKLEEKVNDIFEQMYHGHRRVSIDKKYKVSLLTSIEDNEIESGESEGSNRVKSFAFIAGLVALAKEKIIADAGEDFILSSEPYPLVMDAPFSNADEVHTTNISRILPEIAEQVIMFVMQKDWNYAEPVMNSRVGKQYTLRKMSETYTILE